MPLTETLRNSKSRYEAPRSGSVSRIEWLRVTPRGRKTLVVAQSGPEQTLSGTQTSRDQRSPRSKDLPGSRSHTPKVARNQGRSSPTLDRDRLSLPLNGTDRGVQSPPHNRSAVVRLVAAVAGSRGEQQVGHNPRVDRQYAGRAPRRRYRSRWQATQTWSDRIPLRIDHGTGPTST
jgi:hypothetical protein